MKNIFLLYSLILLMQTGFCQWSTVTTLNDAGEFPSISVASPNVVWIAGGFPGQPVVYKTLDGGVNWIKTDTTGLGNFELTTLYAVDSLTAYVGNGGSVGAQGGNATFFKTNDGGNTWTAIASTGGIGGFFNGIEFSRKNPMFGVAHSAPPGSFGQPYYLAITNDGGITWNVTNAPGVPNARGAQNSLFVIDDQFYGFGLSGISGSVYYTNDGGNTWNIGNLGLPGNFVSTFAFNDDKMRAVAATQSSLPVIARTSDGGTTWTQINTLSGGGSSNGTAKWIDSTDYVYVSDATMSNAFVRRSVDGGITWNNMNTAGVGNIQHMDFYRNGNTVYGFAITHASGIVLKMTDVITGINDPDNYSFEANNFPNPFQSVTSLSFDIGNEMHVEIVVYDALGKEVKVLLNEHLVPGRYNVEFDGSELESGIYYYTIKNGKHIESKQMILIK